MEDMATEVEAKEQVHVQEINTLERKLLIDKGNMQKVRQMETRKMPQTKGNCAPRTAHQLPHLLTVSKHVQLHPIARAGETYAAFVALIDHPR